MGACNHRLTRVSASERAGWEVQGYSHVPEYDEEAVMEALYSRGPLAVSIDAAAPGFRFYVDGSIPATILP